MVHEGDVNQGHYWAYVYHHEKNVWLKFNDNTVSETSWEELRKESVGGHCNTSAYSMVYIDQFRKDLIGHATENNSSCPTSSTLSVPPDMHNFLIEDNKVRGLGSGPELGTCGIFWIF